MGQVCAASRLMASLDVQYAQNSQSTVATHNVEERGEILGSYEYCQMRYKREVLAIRHDLTLFTVSTSLGRLGRLGISLAVNHG